MNLEKQDKWKSTCNALTEPEFDPWGHLEIRIPNYSGQGIALTLPT